LFDYSQSRKFAGKTAITLQFGAKHNTSHRTRNNFLEAPAVLKCLVFQALVIIAIACDSCAKRL